jgi:hypothetical protein
MNPPPLLGQLMPSDARSISPAFWDLLLVVGVTVVLAVIIFIIAAVSHRGHRHRKRSRSGPEILRNTEEFRRVQDERAEREDEQESDRHHRRKRRRREHRRRNPTLAEGDGLPPERAPGVAPKADL